MSRCEGCGGEDCVCCSVYIEEQYDARYQLEEDADNYDYYRPDDDDEE